MSGRIAWSALGLGWKDAVAALLISMIVASNAPDRRLGTIPAL